MLGAEAVSAVVVRELLEADLEKITPGSTASGGSGGESIKRLRDSHHGLARILAGGVSPVEASAITGFSLSNIFTLKGDPAFQELLSFYENEAATEAIDLRERLKTLALDVSQIIQERLIENPDSFSNAELRQFLATLADRTGVGPSSTVHAEVDIINRLSYTEQRELEKQLTERLKSLEGQAIDITPPR